MLLTGSRPSDSDRRCRNSGIAACPAPRISANSRCTASPSRSSPPSVAEAYVDLYWLPLGAGGHFVRLNGRLYEAIVASVQHRKRQDLYHSALEVGLAEQRSVIEMAPVWNE